MKGRYYYACGVPAEFCSGTRFAYSKNAGVSKNHRSPEEALKCMGHHLVNQLGYTRLTKTTYSHPDKPVLVLSRQSKYGGKMRPGKENSRAMPMTGPGRSCKGGMII